MRSLSTFRAMQQYDSLYVRIITYIIGLLILSAVLLILKEKRRERERERERERTCDFIGSRFAILEINRRCFIQ